MPTSADGRTARTRVCSGFTLLEVMITVAVVAVAVLPLLEARERATNMAYWSTHALGAMRHAEELMARWTLEADTFEERTGVVEEDPSYRWTLALERFDLSTGHIAEEDDEDLFHDPNTPPDAVASADDDDRYMVRRLRLTLAYPGLGEDVEEKLELTTFLPPVLQNNEEESLLKP